MKLKLWHPKMVFDKKGYIMSEGKVCIVAFSIDDINNPKCKIYLLINGGDHYVLYNGKEYLKGKIEKNIEDQVALFIVDEHTEDKKYVEAVEEFNAREEDNKGVQLFD